MLFWPYRKELPYLSLTISTCRIDSSEGLCVYNTWLICYSTIFAALSSFISCSLCCSTISCNKVTQISVITLLENVVDVMYPELEIF